MAADFTQLFSGFEHRNYLVHFQLAFHRSSLPTQKFILKSTPFPTHLQLRNFPPRSIDIGWDNLTHASLCALSANECLEVLRRAPKLEYCHASEIREPSDGPTVNLDTTIILHSRLRILLTAYRVTEFLNTINVPALEEWTHHTDIDPSNITTMVSLPTRSGSYLKMLDLYLSAPSDRDDLPILLQTMPSLERLQLRFRPNDNIFDRIFRSPADGSIIPLGDASREMFLPRLQFMECTEPFFWDLVPQLYRQGHRHSLTLKSPTNMSETSDETAMELLKLVDEGAKFQIIDTSENGVFLENSSEYQHYISVDSLSVHPLIRRFTSYSERSKLWINKNLSKDYYVSVYKYNAILCSF